MPRGGTLKGVSEKMEEFLTEEDNLGEDTMNVKKAVNTARSQNQGGQVSTMVRDPSEDQIMKNSTLKNQNSTSRPQSGQPRV